MVKEEVDWCLGWSGVQVMVGRLWMIYDPHDHSNYSLSPSAHKPRSSVSGSGQYYYFLTTSRRLDGSTNGLRWWSRSTSAKLAHFRSSCSANWVIDCHLWKGMQNPSHRILSHCWEYLKIIKCYLGYPDSLSWAKGSLTRKRDFVGISPKWQTPPPSPFKFNSKKNRIFLAFLTSNHPFPLMKKKRKHQKIGECLILFRREETKNVLSTWACEFTFLFSILHSMAI